MEFDSYWEWLRIPPGNRPLNHYGLLGLAAGEPDLSRIRTAALERIAYVRRFQLSPRSDESIRLQLELAGAFDCLTNPERKRAYDQGLTGHDGFNPEGGVTERSELQILKWLDRREDVEEERFRLSVQALRVFLGRHDLSHDRVCIAIPGDNGWVRFCRIAAVEPARLPEVVTSLARRQIPCSLDEVVWDFQVRRETNVAESASAELELSLFATKRELLARYLNPFREAEVEVDVAQLRPLALSNFGSYEVISSTASDLGFIVLLDMGAESTELVITDGVRFWGRNVPLGGDHFTRALAKEFQLTFSGAEQLKRSLGQVEYAPGVFEAMGPVLKDLVRQIEDSIAYFSDVYRDARITRIVCLGNAFRLAGLLQFLGENLKYEVAPLAGIRGLSGPLLQSCPDFRENVSSFATAYGLALQGLGLSRIRTNLLASEISRVRHARRRLLRASLLGFAAVAMLAFALLLWNMMGTWNTPSSPLGPAVPPAALVNLSAPDSISNTAPDLAAQPSMADHANSGAADAPATDGATEDKRAPTSDSEIAAPMTVTSGLNRDREIASGRDQSNDRSPDPASSPSLPASNNGPTALPPPAQPKNLSGKTGSSLTSGTNANVRPGGQSEQSNSNANSPTTRTPNKPTAGAADARKKSEKEITDQIVDGFRRGEPLEVAWLIAQSEARQDLSSAFRKDLETRKANLHRMYPAVRAIRFPKNAPSVQVKVSPINPNDIHIYTYSSTAETTGSVSFEVSNNTGKNFRDLELSIYIVAEDGSQLYWQGRERVGLLRNGDRSQRRVSWDVKFRFVGGVRILVLAESGKEY
ncbi:MAG: pilus assembly protein PilM [Planctomycetes bacterium]|nr:pilus assembly protein PilM [Planctomycetota bacterium]